MDAFVDIAKAGKITGANKSIDRYRQVYAFGAGTQKMYDYIDGLHTGKEKDVYGFIDVAGKY